MRGARKVKDAIGNRFGSNGIVRMWIRNCSNAVRYISSDVLNALNGRTASWMRVGRLGVFFDVTGYVGLDEYVKRNHEPSTYDASYCFSNK